MKKNCQQEMAMRALERQVIAEEMSGTHQSCSVLHILLDWIQLKPEGAGHNCQH